MALIKRSVRVFVLERCTAALVLMEQGEAQRAAEAINSLIISSYQFLAEDDPVRQ